MSRFFFLSFLAFCSFVLPSPSARADEPDARHGLYVSAAFDVGAGGGPTWITPEDANEGSKRGATSVIGFGPEVAIGYALRPDVALALDLTGIYAGQTNGGTDLAEARALALVEWYEGRHLHFRAGAGAEVAAALSYASSEVYIPGADYRTPSTLAGPAALFGVGTTLGAPGRAGLAVGIDLGAAYLTSNFEHFVPLTATLRIGVTSF